LGCHRAVLADDAGNLAEDSANTIKAGVTSWNFIDYAAWLPKHNAGKSCLAGES
jgi:hypothetical protein